MRHMRAVSLGLALAAGFCAPAAAAPGDEIYTRPGRMVEADGALLNLYCMGSGSPTVVFDAGHQDWAPAWATIQPEVAKWTRTCSYDRAGNGFSGPGPMPRTSERIARELHDALHAAGVNGPYVLVGHAFGGYNMRAFAYRYLPDVAGLVLVDSDVGDTAADEWVAASHNVFIRQAVDLRRCRDAVAANPSDAVSPGPPELSCDRRFFRGFPEKSWSEPLNQLLLHEVRTRPELFDTVIAELQELPGNEFYLRQHRQSLGKRPVRVLIAAPFFTDTAATPPEVHARHVRLEAQRMEAQKRLLALSSNSKLIVARHSPGAYIQFDEPGLVLQAIREAAGR
ncbi:MAG TPA: alpha/beta hydrolase [Allosphingosinicella sp.]|jgi:pimeloyl-ACP methyl ester carboxylesterase|nr:alpha/beta hydrolase [Allosphingosinicella sp.]